MILESKITEQVYLSMKFHNSFKKGEYSELNNMISEDFQGWLYMPWSDKVEHYNAEKIREGNKNAASFYNGKDIKFTYTGLSVLPQTEEQAAVSYEVIYQHESQVIRALVLEVWRKEKDGEWRVIRWYEEKGSK
jgi:hypothetical protein